MLYKHYDVKMYVLIYVFNKIIDRTVNDLYIKLS